MRGSKQKNFKKNKRVKQNLQNINLKTMWVSPILTN